MAVCQVAGVWANAAANPRQATKKALRMMVIWPKTGFKLLVYANGRTKSRGKDFQRRDAEAPKKIALGASGPPFLGFLGVSALKDASTKMQV